MKTSLAFSGLSKAETPRTIMASPTCSKTSPGKPTSRALCSKSFALLVICPLAFSLPAGQPATFQLPAGSDSAEIQRALDRLPDGGEVVLAPGTYVVRQPLVLQRDRQTLRGSGPAN